ncbi:hypothetical protein MMC10_001942 [Thelotrema lepadinum]|nr:hypothetical protein [Thelotrema lepadinum]
MVFLRIRLLACLSLLHLGATIADSGGHSPLDTRGMIYFGHAPDLSSRDYPGNYDPSLFARDIPDQPYARSTSLDELVRRELENEVLERRVLSPKQVKERIELVDKVTGWNPESDKPLQSTWGEDDPHLQKVAPADEGKQSIIRGWKKQMSKELKDLYAKGRDKEGIQYRNAMLRYVRFEKKDQAKSSTSQEPTPKANKVRRFKPRAGALRPPTPGT